MGQVELEVVSQEGSIFVHAVDAMCKRNTSIATYELTNEPPRQSRRLRKEGGRASRKEDKLLTPKPYSWLLIGGAAAV